MFRFITGKILKQNGQTVKKEKKKITINNKKKSPETKQKNIKNKTIKKKLNPRHTPAETLY